jgi:hypothetical protein
VEPGAGWDASRDVYSLGMLLLEMSISMQDSVQDALRALQAFDVGPVSGLRDLPNEATEFIFLCLIQNSACRPSVEALLQVSRTSSLEADSPQHPFVCLEDSCTQESYLSKAERKKAKLKKLCIMQSGKDLSCASSREITPTHFRNFRPFREKVPLNAEKRSVSSHCFQRRAQYLERRRASIVALEVNVSNARAGMNQITVLQSPAVHLESSECFEDSADSEFVNSMPEMREISTFQYPCSSSDTNVLSVEFEDVQVEPCQDCSQGDPVRLCLDQLGASNQES